MTWVLPTPIKFGAATYPTITLRSPSAGDVLLANAKVTGASGMQVSLQLIAGISIEAVPYEALAQLGSDGLPAYLLDQMSSYLDMFGGAPFPGPLVEWNNARIASAKAEAAAKAAAEQTPAT